MTERAHWCQFCHQTRPDADLQPLHQLEAILPEYDHSVCSYEPVEAGGFSAALKLRARAVQEVQKWLEDFQSSSKTTWRILKTYPSMDTSLRNKYRVDLRCQHKVYGRDTSSKKNTFCPALLYLILKKDTFSQGRKSRSCDLHLHHHLTFHINLRNTHNHEINGPESLRFRDVSKETVQKLEKLFGNGHSPSSALKALKEELRAQTGDSFEAAVSDHALCPDLQFCFRLFYKIFPHKKKKRKIQDATGKGMFSVQSRTAAEACEQPPSDLGLQEVCVSSTPALPDHSFIRVLDLGSVQTPSWRPGTEDRLRAMFQDLLRRLKTEETFEEPVKAMLCSYEAMSSDAELISALNTFGKTQRGNSGRPAKRARLKELIES